MSRPDSGSEEMYVTDGHGCRTSGILPDGVSYVGRTVSRHMRQVLGGQCLAGLGVVSGAASALDWAWEVVDASSPNAPGMNELLALSVDAWMSCGQFHSGFGLKEVEAIALRKFEVESDTNASVT